MHYKCGMYCRLSDADKKSDESSSIQSQKMIIESFANFNKMEIVKKYVDDGFSGGNFERPGFKEMIKDIETGLINCVLTKDLSRLGREMYGTGKYIEEFFRDHRIRYVAINDSYDSDIGDSMLGLRLSVNDLYLRDVSKKVKTSFRAKQLKGDYIGSLPLYGYKKDLNDKHKLLVDENVRDIIEFIYEEALEGITPGKIAEVLTIRKQDIPIVYKKEIRGSKVTENEGHGIWKRQTVKNILTNQMYIGNMVQNVYNKVSYNSKKIRKTDDDENIIVEGTHEAIISKETFDKVQEILNKKTSSKRTFTQDKYLFGSLLFCKECGRTIRVSEDIKKHSISHYTQCNLYTRKGKFGVCSSHRLNYDWLENDLLEYLKETCTKFCKTYGINDIEDNSSIVIKENLKKLTSKIDMINLAIKNTKEIMDSSYIDKISGVINEDMFKRIYDKNNNDLIMYNEDLKKLEQLLEMNKKNTKQNSELFVCKKAVEEFMTLKEPSKEVINSLINRIEIDKERNVYIHLNYRNLNSTYMK